MAREVTSDEEATFTNDYQVEATGYTPTVTKAVTGDVPEGRDAQFRFALTAREDNPEGAVLPADTEVTIEGSGKADFGEIRFEQAGTYRFDITEINDKLPGYQYDGSVWTLTVVVKDTEHILGVESATYTRQDEATSDVAAFENHYQPNEAAYAPRVTKHCKRRQDAVQCDIYLYHAGPCGQSGGRGSGRNFRKRSGSRTDCICTHHIYQSGNLPVRHP